MVLPAIVSNSGYNASDLCSLGPSQLKAFEFVKRVNAFPINGDGPTQNLKEVSGTLPDTFKLFADKSLVFQATVSSSDIFRLPSGYKSDTFEVAVSGSARIRAIHLGETPIGLKTA